MELTRIYKLIPYLLIALALGAIAFLLITGNTALLIKSPIFILLAFIIGSLFIILTKKHHSESININKIANLNLPQRTLQRIFIIAGALMMITVLLGLKDSVIYIALLVILAVCIILQILSKNVSVGWVIGELLYVAAMLIFPFVFAYEYYYDGSDIIYHTYYTNTIIETGQLNLLTASGEIYSAFPGLHLSTAITSFMTGLPTNISLYIFLTLVFLGLSIFTYLIAKEFFPSITIALLALYIVLIPAVGSSALISYAPYVFLSSLALIVLYLIFHKSDDIKIHLLLLAIPTILCCLLAHHANNLPLLGILFFFLVTDLVIIPLFTKYKEKHTHGINIGIILMYFAMCGCYIYYTYLRTSLHFLLLIFSPSSTNVTNTWISSNNITNISISELLYQWLNLSNVWICIIPALSGMYLLLINKKVSRKGYLLGFFMLIFFILFANVFSAIPGANSLNTYRFYNIIFALFASGVAFGICYIALHIKHKSKAHHMSQTIVVVFCLLLLITPCLTFAAENDVLKPLNIPSNYPDDNTNNHFSTGEMIMLNFVTKSIPIQEHYSTDPEAKRYLLYTIPENSATSILPLFKTVLDATERQCNTYSYILLREEHFKERSLMGGATYSVTGNLNSEKREYINPDPNTIKCFATNTQNHGIIYSNGGSYVYAV